MDSPGGDRRDRTALGPAEGRAPRQRRATSRALLEAIRPRVAAISVGADNDYGHPATEPLDRLAEVGATVWRTDQLGTLSVVLDGRG